MKHLYSAILATLAIVSGVSCARKEEPECRGRITLELSTVALETKAVTPGDGNLADGGGIAVNGSGEPDIVIAIADKNDDIVAWYPENYGAVPAGTTYDSSCLTPHTASTPATESIINISGPEKGTYKVFAVANTTGLSAVGSPALSSATTLSDLQDLVLAAIGDISFSTCMPLSAWGTLSVNSSGNGQIDLELKRVVARASLTFKNQTGEALKLYACSITIHDMNPSRGYLFSRTTDYVSGYDNDLEFNGDSPYLTVPVIDPEDPASVNTYTLPSKLVFPSVAPAQSQGNRYLCDISFRIVKENKTYDAGDPTTYTQHDYYDLPVHDRRSADIQLLARNQDLKIETRINKRVDENDISFNFEVLCWTDVVDEFVFFH
jgi:hypothetical protein